MKRPLALLTGLIAIALLFVIGLWIGRGTDGPGVIAPTHAANAESGAPAQADLAHPADGDSGPDDLAAVPASELQSRSAAEVMRQEEPEAVAFETRTLRGRVIAPAQLSQELAELEVIATSRPASLGRVIALIEEDLRDTFSTRYPAMLGLDFGDLGDDDDDENIRNVIVARVPVDAEGGFSIDVRELGSAHLSVIGPRALTWTSREVRADTQGEVQLFVELGAVIEGRLRTAEGGIPAAGALVELDSAVPAFNGIPTSQRTIRRVVSSDKDGRFRFESLTTESDFLLKVFPTDGPPTQHSTGMPGPGDIVQIEIVLPRAARAEGRVVDASGTAVPNARVIVESSGQMFGFDTRVLAQETCDDEGNFVLDALPTGNISIRARADGWLESRSEKLSLEPGAQRKGIELALEEGGVITGSITWPGGLPAADIEVLATFERSQLMGMTAMRALRGFGSRATSDEEGHFRITGLGRGPFTVSAHFDKTQAEDAEPTTGAALKVAQVYNASEHDVLPGDTKQPKQVQLEFAISPGLAGIVQDAAGLPVTRFEIRAARMAESSMGKMATDRRSKLFESEDGSFFLPELSPGLVTVQVIADGYVPEEIEDVEVPRPEGEPLIVNLTEGGNITGLVRDPFGSPVSDAKVTVGSSGADWTRGMRGDLDPPSTRTDSAGRFTLTELELGEELTVSAKKIGFAKSEGVTASATPSSEEPREVSLVLRTGGRIVGEVFKEGGVPAGGRSVQAMHAETWESHTATTDGDGRFTIDHLIPGRWQVSSMATGMNETITSDDDLESGGLAEFLSETKTAVAEVEDGEEAFVTLGAPPSDPVDVTGRVTHAGSAYKGALVTYLAEKKGISPQITQVDSKGEYLLTLDSPGRYVVFVQKLSGQVGEQNSIEFTVEIPDSERHREDFEIPTARISGHVRGPDGAPQSGVRISLRSQGSIDTRSFLGGQFSEGRTDTEGNYDIQGLAPGSYFVSAGGMQTGGLFGTDADYSREIRSDIELGKGQWLEDLDFRLKAPGELVVTVTDNEGRPVEGATAFVRDADGVLLDRFSFLSTGSNGKVEIGGLTPGRCTVSVRKGTRSSADSAPVRIESDVKSTVELTLEEGTKLAISIRDSEDNIISASISVEDGDGKQWNGMMAYGDLIETFSQGFSTEERLVGPLPPGRYKVVARTADGKTAKKRLTLRNSQSVRRFTLWPKR